jgi:hypothetical protein
MLQIKPTNIKDIASISGAVKDVSPGGAKKNYWNSVHRLVLKGTSLQLLTNDGSIWLTWNIPLEAGEGEFDILIPAAQFNDVAARSAEGSLYNLTRDKGIFCLSQGKRNLRLREDSPQTYPEPEKGNGAQEFTVNSLVLAKALAFVSPFQDVSNPQINKTVLTWYPEGFMLGGSPRRMAKVERLPKPLKMMSFKQRNARAIAAFLRKLVGDVKITIDDRHYTFTCVTHGHQIQVMEETASFPDLIKNLEKQLTETYKIDNKTINSCVSILGTVLTTDMDRLNMRFRGKANNASLRMSTMGDDSKNSNDEFPLIRKYWKYETELKDITEESEAADTWLSINAKVLQEAIAHMEGTYLDCHYYKKMKMLYIQDEVGNNETDIVRSILVTVQPSTAAEAEKEPVVEAVVEEKKEVPATEKTEVAAN